MMQSAVWALSCALCVALSLGVSAGCRSVLRFAETRLALLANPEEARRALCDGARRAPMPRGGPACAFQLEAKSAAGWRDACTLAPADPRRAPLGSRHWRMSFSCYFTLDSKIIGGRLLEATALR